MIKAYIKELSYYLPEKIVTNEEIVRDFPEWSVDKIAQKVGVCQRHIADINETSADMAAKAAEIVFSKGTVKKDSIDYLLFCTQTPDYFLPTSACLIQERLGLRTNIGALDFNLGCSGYVYGLSLAKGLVESEIATNVLLLTGESYNKFLHPRDKGNRTIFGDAASATIVSTSGFAEIGKFILGTNGKGAENLIVKTGALRHHSQINDLSFDENNNPVSSDYLYMNGSEIFVFTLDNIPPLINDVLAINDLKSDDIDRYIFHQANKYMLNVLRKKLKIEEEKFCYCLENCGNTVSNSIPIALKVDLDNGLLFKSKNVLLAGFGVGYSWAGTILKFI